MELKLKARMRLVKQYAHLKLQANKLMLKGRVDDYIKTLFQLDNIRKQLELK